MIGPKNMKAKAIQTLLLICFMMIANVAARKSYVIKEKIEQGELKVHSPRVMANDVKFCFLKDDNNDYCVEGDLNWKVEFKTEQEFKKDFTLTTKPHFNYTFTY